LRTGEFTRTGIAGVDALDRQQHSEPSIDALSMAATCCVFAWQWLQFSRSSVWLLSADLQQERCGELALVSDMARRLQQLGKVAVLASHREADADWNAGTNCPTAIAAQSRYT